MSSTVFSYGWKYISSFALLIASGGFLLQSLHSARAEIGPMVGLGSNPYAAFYGSISSGTNIFTVPSDRAFIITTFLIDHNDLSYSNSFGCQLQIDGVTAIQGSMIKNYGMTGNTDTMAVAATSFIQGKAHLPVAPGSTVRIDGSCNTSYYVEGYYVVP